MGTGCPAIEMTLSLAWIPATSAGEAGWPGAHAAPLSRALTDLGRHLVIAPIELVPGTPMATASRNSSTKASAKCMNDPATSTMARCQPGLLRNEPRLVGHVDLFQRASSR